MRPHQHHSLAGPGPRHFASELESGIAQGIGWGIVAVILFYMFKGKVFI